MERTLTSEERIRRAEEIYARRRRQNGIRVPTNAVNNTRDFNLFKKMILQIAICLMIYCIFYLIKNTNYIFSEMVIEQTKSFLSYDMNFEKYYLQAVEYYNNNIKNFFINKKNEEENNNEVAYDIDTTNSLDEKNIVEENKIVEEQNGIGGGENSEIQQEVANESISEVLSDEVNVEELTQMEIDANEIKNNYSLIVPLNRNYKFKIWTKNTN